MNELIKKGFYLGLGAAFASKEKAEKYMKELVKNGELAPQEAKRFINELGEKGKGKQEAWSAQFREEIASSLKQIGFVSAEEFEETKKQLNKLEEKLSAMTNTDKDET